MFKKALTTMIAATALMGASAHAAPARALSVAPIAATMSGPIGADVRAASAPGKSNGLFGMGQAGTLIGVLATIFGIWGIVELTGDDAPTSP